MQPDRPLSLKLAAPRGRAEGYRRHQLAGTLSARSPLLEEEEEQEDVVPVEGEYGAIRSLYQRILSDATRT